MRTASVTVTSFLFGGFSHCICLPCSVFEFDITEERKVFVSQEVQRMSY